MKYSDDIVDQICFHLEHGALEKDAAIMSGISEDTYHRWKRDNEDFKSRVDLAISAYRQTLINLLNYHSVTDGKIALEILARRWPKEFGSSAKLWLSSTNEESDELKELIDIIKQATPQADEPVEGEIVDEPKQIQAPSQQTV